MAIYQITFSPTGGTRKVAQTIASGIGDSIETLELCVPVSKLTEVTLSTDDVAVIAMPVYGGRIPSLAIERLQSQIKADGAQCVIVAVYGNRAYDDALLEMFNTCTKMGFQVVAAVGAVAEHSIVRKYGATRPDADDMYELKTFGDTVKKALAAGTILAKDKLPGKFPYKNPMAGPNPTADSSCLKCGACADNCPVGAISMANLRKVDKSLCVSCMRCVSVCPNGARSIGKIMHGMIALAIKKGCAERKKNELFI